MEKKIDVFLDDEYRFYIREIGEKMNTIVRSGNMLEISNEGREFSFSECDDVSLNVIKVQNKNYIVDVVSYQKQDLTHLSWTERLNNAENFLKFNKSYEIRKYYDLDEMMNLYFDGKRDILFRHLYTGETGVMSHMDFQNYFQYLYEEEKNRKDKEEDLKDEKIETVEEIPQVHFIEKPVDTVEIPPPMLDEVKMIYNHQINLAAEMIYISEEKTKPQNKDCDRLDAKVTLVQNIPKKKNSELYEHYLGVREAIEQCQRQQKEFERIQEEKLAGLSSEQRAREEKILEYYKHRKVELYKKEPRYFDIPSREEQIGKSDVKNT